MKKTEDPAPESLSIKEKQSRETRKKILDAAMELFSSKGFAATSTRKVSRLAGVSEGLIFHHFKTKADLLMGLVDQKPSLAGAIVRIIEERQNAPVRECLEAVGNSFVHIREPDSRMFNMLLSESRTNDRLYEVFREVMIRTIAQMGLYLEGRKEAGELRDDLNTQTAAESFFSLLIFFFLQNHHLDRAAWVRESEAYFKAQLELWLRGVSSDGRGSIGQK